MPGPTSVSGVAATVEGGYKGEGLGSQLVDMAEAYTRVKQAEQAHAAQKYQTMLSTMDKLPIDANELRKVAKKAGMPLPKDETIAAIAEVGKQQKQGAAAAKPAAAGGTGIEGAARTGVNAAQQQQQQNPDAAAAAAQKKWQDNMTPQQGLQYVLNTWYARGQQLAESKFKDEKAKTEFSTHLSQVKDAAMAGDKEATGKLMSAAEVPYNINQLAWQAASPEQKETMYGVAQGHETEAQKLDRQTQIQGGLMQKGLSAADAYTASKAMAAGQSLSPEMQKKLGAPSFKQLGEEADFMNTALQLGVPADKLQSTAATAMATGSLVTALPKALQPVMQKELELRQQQINMEMARTRVESKRADAMATSASIADRRATAYEKHIDNESKNQDFRNQATLAKLHVAEITGENKQYLDSLKSMIQMKKAGVEVDSKELQKTLDGLQSYGVDKDFVQYLTGQPASATPGGDPVEDELGGGKSGGGKN